MAGSWQTFTAPSGVSADTMLLLNDGSALVHNADGTSGSGAGENDWYRLTPDDTDRYRNGSWSSALRMTTERQFFATGGFRPHHPSQHEARTAGRRDAGAVDLPLD